MKRSFRNLSSGIVPRLRITFFVIAAVLVLQMAVGVWQVRTLNASARDLSERAVGTLLLTEASERDLKKIVLLLQKANTNTSPGGLALLKIDLNATLDTLNTSIPKMIAADATGQSSQAIEAALAQIGTDAAQVIAMQSASDSYARNLNRFAAYLETIRVTTRGIMETLSFEATHRTGETISGTTNTLDGTSPRLLSQITENLALANTLTSLTLQVNGTFDRAATMVALTKREAIDARQRALRSEMRNLVVLVGQLPDSPTRLELARALQELRTLLFAPKGLVSEVVDRAELQANLNQLLQRQNQPINVISALSKQLNTRARDRVATATFDLNSATQTLVYTVSLTTLASLLAIILASYNVVERQINARMVRLTKAVTSIADGDTAYKVDVHGPDELGRIAKALEVFKVNAT